MQSISWAIEAGRPLLGVCLGQQAIGEFFGGVVEYAPQLMHGKTSRIEHDGSGVFAGVPSPFDATRYHSLCIAHAPFPAELRAVAASDDAVIQGVSHRTLPIHGVQFHPESVLTPEGGRIFANFLALARVPV
jgi:anthranilate synthase component 2